MKGKFIYFILVLTFSYWFTSCVPARKFQEEKEQHDLCEDQNYKLRIDNQNLVVRNTELEGEMDILSKNINKLTKDSTEQGTAYRRLNNTYRDLTDSYEKLLSNNEKLLAGNSSENKKLIEDLNKTRNDLSQ